MALQLLHTQDTTMHPAGSPPGERSLRSSFMTDCYIKGCNPKGEYPILTLTATRDDFAIAAPSEAYVKTIVSGLAETWPRLRKSEILDYLGQAQGIRDVIQADVLAGWILDQ